MKRAVASDAEVDGNTRYVANFVSVARTLRGMSCHMSTRGMRAAELLSDS
ncbi:hypothetical protein [Rhizobium ruizarguesonis]|nr:hypothetical protein [Rhizobium ruizarguesonis]